MKVLILFLSYNSTPNKEEEIQLLELLKKRRSIRVFEERKVEEEKVETILKGALLSPSSKNRKPWEFIVVTNEGLLKELASCREHGSHFLQKAPLGVVILGNPKSCDVWIEDCSIAAIIIQLTAESLGLGSCWIQVRNRETKEGEKAEEYIKRLLNIPPVYHVECVVAIGYKGEAKEFYREEDLLTEKIYYNRR